MNANKHNFPYIYFGKVIFKPISVIDDWGISCEIVLGWFPLDLADDKWILVGASLWLGAVRQLAN